MPPRLREGCAAPLEIMRVTAHPWVVLIRKPLSGMNLASPNRLWFVIPAKAGIQEWGFLDGHEVGTDMSKVDHNKELDQDV